MLRRHYLTAVLFEHASYTLSPHLSVIFLEPWGLESMAQMLHPRLQNKASACLSLTWVLEVKLRVLMLAKQVLCWLCSFPTPLSSVHFHGPF